MRVPAPPCGCDRVRVARACARVYACACAVSQGLMLLSMRTEWRLDMRAYSVRLHAVAVLL